MRSFSRLRQKHRIHYFAGQRGAGAPFPRRAADGWAIEPSAAPCPLPNPSTHGVDLLTTTHGNGSRDCENTLKRTTLIALSLGLLAPLAAHAAQDLPTLYQAFEEAGNSSLGMDELNQTVTFTAVALSVSSNLAGEPLIQLHAAVQLGNGLPVLRRLQHQVRKKPAKRRLRFPAL